MGPHIENLLGYVLRRLRRKEGQTLVEYSLILAVISIVMIAVMKLLGARVTVIFSAVTTLLDTAQSSH
jgi:Flp pilus assembly pilin Flp